jgi:hypothetical protein
MHNHSPEPKPPYTDIAPSNGSPGRGEIMQPKFALIGLRLAKHGIFGSTGIEFSAKNRELSSPF